MLTLQRTTHLMDFVTHFQNSCMFCKVADGGRNGFQVRGIEIKTGGRRSIQNLMLAVRCLKLSELGYCNTTYFTKVTSVFKSSLLSVG